MLASLAMSARSLGDKRQRFLLIGAIFSLAIQGPVFAQVSCNLCEKDERPVVVPNFSLGSTTYTARIEASDFSAYLPPDPGGPVATYLAESFPWWGSESAARAAADAFSIIASPVVAYSVRAQVSSFPVRIIEDPYFAYDITFAYDPANGPAVEEVDSPQAMAEISPALVATAVKFARRDADHPNSYIGSAPVSARLSWLRVVDARATAVPGPLPLFGAATAFGLSRRLRRRISMGS